MNKLISDWKYVLGLWTIFVLSVALTLSHHGHFIIDCGREAYYPSQILLGKVLYKDIFNIYGPFSYLFNAFLFKLFGVNLSVLYVSGVISAFAIVNLSYLIARRFLSKFQSVSIGIFLIVIGVLNTNLFNFIFPYSYAMLYSLVAFLASLLFLLKYVKHSDRVEFAYFATFFASVCVLNKYDFIPYLLIVFYTLWVRKLTFKQSCINFLVFVFPFALCFGFLFKQGLRVDDLTYTAFLLDKMAKSQTLKYFYQATGVFFQKKFLLVDFVTFLLSVVSIAPILLSFKTDKKIFKLPLILLSIILIVKFTQVNLFAFLPILITLFMIYDWKNIKNRPEHLILTLASLSVSLKSFWTPVVLNYGSFSVPVLLIAAFALFNNKFANEKINKSLGVYLILVSLSFGFLSFSRLNLKNNLVKTDRGKIYVESEFANSGTELIDFINKNTKQEDKVVILPEGAMVNFLTKRQSDDFYTSLIPLYVELFGGDKLIEHFKKTKPEYIVFNNWNTKDYYFQYICQDYAITFCTYVSKNYTPVKTIDNGLNYLIFKKK